MNDIEWLAERITALRESGRLVAVEMWREGHWVEHVAIEDGMLALYTGRGDPYPTFLIPPGTPVILRLG